MRDGAWKSVLQVIDKPDHPGGGEVFRVRWSQYPGGAKRFLRAKVVLVPPSISSGFRRGKISSIFAEKLRQMPAGRFLRR